MLEILNSEMFRLILSSVVMANSTISIIITTLERKNGYTIRKSLLNGILSYITALGEAFQIFSSTDQVSVILRVVLAILWGILSFFELMNAKKLKECKITYIEITEEMKKQFFKEYGEPFDEGEMDDKKLEKVEEFLEHYKNKEE